MRKKVSDGSETDIQFQREKKQILIIRVILLLKLVMLTFLKTLPFSHLLLDYDSWDLFTL